MTEAIAAVAPTWSASLVGAGAVAFGPEVGPWAAVMLAAVAGSLWSVGNSATQSRLTAFLLLLRLVLTALVFTGAVIALAADQLTALGEHVAPAVAFTIGFLGDRIQSLRAAAAGRLKALIGGSS